jgi:hypothetical protein
MSTQNPVLDELHAARRKILADWNGDTLAYLEDAQTRLEKSGRPIWKGKQRTKDCTEANGRPASDGNPIPSAR